jgi:hypothetical protein
MITFLPNLRSAAAVRRFVRDRLAEHETSIPAELVVLLADELAVNAILHTAQLFDVAVEHSSRCVEVIVSDRSHAALPIPGDPSLDSTDGRGLAIVNALSDSWGWRPTAIGKQVWFRVCASPG